MIAILEKEHRRLLTYSRFGTLSQLYFFGDDGVAYRDIRDSLGLSDSFLSPQLKWLRAKKYVDIKQEKMADEKLAVYYITPSGREVYNKILLWFDSLQIKEIIELNKKGLNDGTKY